MDHDTEYLPPRQFAQLIGVSDSSLAKMRMRGDGPDFVKVGRSVRYQRNAGLAWMAARTRRSTSDQPQTERTGRKKRRTVQAAIAPAE